MLTNKISKKNQKQLITVIGTESKMHHYNYIYMDITLVRPIYYFCFFF